MIPATHLIDFENIYSRRVLDDLKPLVNKRFEVVRGFADPAEYPRLWRDARNAAHRTGRLPLVAIGVLGRMTVLVPHGLMDGGAINADKFATVDEWEFLNWVDHQVEPH